MSLTAVVHPVCSVTSVILLFFKYFQHKATHTHTINYQINALKDCPMYTDKAKLTQFLLGLDIIDTEGFLSGNGDIVLR